MKSTHYFTDNTELPSNRVEHSFHFKGSKFTFITDDGVFSKNQVDYGSLVLIEALLNEDLAGSLLDLGCGYGTLGTILGHYNPQLDIHMTDVNPRATELARLNAEKNHVPCKVYTGDRFEGIFQTFDVIITNPPIRAGKQVIYSMFEESFEHLEKNGTLYVVIRRKQGAESAVKKLNNLFGNCDVIHRDAGYWVLKSSRKLTD